MVTFKRFMKRFWWYWIIIVTILIIMITNRIDGQDITIDVYENGNMIMMDSTEICFIYDISTTFGLSGDTLKILIRKEK